MRSSAQGSADHPQASSPNRPQAPSMPGRSRPARPILPPSPPHLVGQGEVEPPGAQPHHGGGHHDARGRDAAHKVHARGRLDAGVAQRRALRDGAGGGGGWRAREGARGRGLRAARAASPPPAPCQQPAPGQWSTPSQHSTPAAPQALASVLIGQHTRPAGECAECAGRWARTSHVHAPGIPPADQHHPHPGHPP